MLKLVVLILTKEYRDRTDSDLGDKEFEQIMNRGMVDNALYTTEEFKMLDFSVFIKRYEKEGICKQNMLYISDDKHTLNKLQNENCYTVALYHEGVKEILSGTQYALEGLDEIDLDYLKKVHQRYCKIPWEITETKRCRIREMGPQDLEDLYELYKDPEVTLYTEALFADKEREKQYINDYIENIYKYYGFGTWLIHRKEDGKLIGRAGFNYRPGFEEAELGFVIGRSYWRKGYAYEVCRHLLQLGRDVFELEKVQALVDERNIASIALLQKLGFSYVENVILEGQKYSRYLY